MQEKEFKWNYQERCKGEIDSLIAKRESKDFIHAVACAKSGELVESENAFIRYIESQKDHLGYFLLADIQSRLYGVSDIKVEQNYLKSQLLKPLNNLNGSLQAGLLELRKENYSKSISHFIKADSQCYLHGKTPEAILETILSEDKIESIESLEIEEDDSTFGIYSLYTEVVEIEGKLISDIRCAQLLFGMGCCLVELQEFSKAHWFLKQSYELKPFILTYQICYVFINQQFCKSSSLSDILKIRTILPLLQPSDIEELSETFKIFLQCFQQPVGHANKCKGYCFLFDGIKSNKIESFQSAMNANPKCISFQLIACKNFIKDKKYKRSQDILMPLATAYGQNDNFKAFQLLGYALFCQKKFVEATTYYEKALSKSNKKQKLHTIIFLGKSYKRQGKDEKALSVLELSRNFSEIPEKFFEQLYYNFAAVLFRLHRIEEALTNLLKLKDRKNPRFDYLLGGILSGLGQYEKAEELLKSTAGAAFKNNHSYYFLALISVAKGDDLTAESRLQQQLEISNLSVHKQTNFELGKIKFRQNNIPKAIDYLTISIREMAKSDEPYSVLAQVYLKYRAFGELEKTYIEWQSKFPKSIIKTCVSFGNILQFNLRKYQEAIAQYKLYLVAFPNSQEIIYLIAKCNRKLGMDAIALEPLIQLVKKVPSLFECYFQIAQIYINQQMYEEGLHYLKEGFKFEPNHAISLVDLAQIQLFHERNPKSAVQTLKKALLYIDRSPRSYLLLGLAYKKQKKFVKASICFQVSQDLYPQIKSEYAKLNLCFIMYAEGTEETFTLIKTIKRPPIKAAKYYFILAVGELQNNSASNAIFYFECCIREGYTKKYFALSIESILLKRDSLELKKLKEYIILLKQLESVNVGNPVIHKYLGLAYSKYRNSFKLGKQSLEISLAANPESWICMIRKAQCDLQLEVHPELVQKAVQGIPEEIKECLEYQFLQIELFHRLFKYKEALSYASQLKIYQMNKLDQKQAQFLLGRAQYMSGEIDLGQKTLTNCYQLPQAQIFQTEILIKSRKYDSAEDILKLLFNQDEDNSQTLHVFGMFYYQQQRYKHALIYLQPYIFKGELFNLELRIALSDCYLKLKDFKNSILYSESIITKYPNHVQAHFILGQSLYNSLKYKKALQIFEEGIKYDPTHLEMRYHLSLCLYQLEEYRQAEKILINCIEEKRVAAYIISLGEVYIKLNDFKNAEIQFEDCLKMEPQNANALISYSELLGTYMKDEKRALDTINNCLTLYPEHSEAIFQLFYLHTKFKNIKVINQTLTFQKNIFEEKNCGLLMRILELIYSKGKFDIDQFRKRYALVIQVETNLGNNSSAIVQVATLRLAELLYMKRDFNEANEKNKQLAGIFKDAKMKEEAKKTGYYFLRAQLGIQKQDFTSVELYLSKCIRYTKSKSEKMQAQISLLGLYAEQRSKKGQKILEELNKTHSEDENFMIIKAQIILNQLKGTRSVEERHDILNKAKDILSICRDLHKSNKLCCFLLGKCYFYLKDFGKANPYLLQSSKMLNSSVKSVFERHLNQVQSLQLSYSLAIISGDGMQIITAIEDLATLSNSESLNHYTEYLYEKGDKTETIHYGKRASKLDPSNPHLHFMIGSLQIPEQAIHTFRRCKQIENNYPEIDFLIAKAYEESGFLDQALEGYIQLLSFKDPSTFILEKCIILLTSLQKFSLSQTLIDRYLLVHSDLPVNLCLLQSHLYHRQDEKAKAIELLYQLVARFPDNPQCYVSLGNFLYERQKYSELIQIYKKLVKKEFFEKTWSQHFRIQILNLLANSYLFIKNYNESKSHYQQILAIDPTQIEDKMNLGLCFIGSGELEKAKTYFTSLVESQKAEILPVFYLGLVHQLQKQDALAIRMYRKVLLNYQLFAPASINMSLLFRKQHNFKEAINVLLPFSQTTRMQIVPLYHLALTYFQASEWSNTISVLTKLIANYDSIIENNRSQQNIPLVSICEQLSLEEAEKQDFAISYSKSHLRIPTKEMLNLLLSRTYRCQNRIDNELKLLENCIAHDVNNAKYIFTHTVSNSIAHKRSHGLSHYERCIQLDPERKELYLLAISNEFHKQGMYEIEIEELKKIISVLPRFKQALLNLGTAYFQVHDYAKAIEVFQKCIEIDSKDAEVMYNLANTFLAMRQVDLAIVQYKKALEIIPSHTFAWYNLGISYSLNKNLSSAVECYQKCISLDPFHVDKYQPRIQQIYKQQAQEFTIISSNLVA